MTTQELTSPVTAAHFTLRVTPLSNADDCTPNGAMVAELSALQQHGILPHCERFDVNSRTGWVTLDLRSYNDFKTWIAALNITREPVRYLYPEEHAVRWNVRVDDPQSGWKLDLNARLFLDLGEIDGVMLALTDDNIDAIELVLEGGA